MGCKQDDKYCASCGATLAADGSSGASDPLIGRTVGGSYTLQEIVGVGGMGRVYRAEQGVLGRTVAIKVIHPHLLGDEMTVARFYTEARAASRLNHPNSVSIIDFGRTDDGIHYLAMEYLQGNDLAIVMHEDGPLPFKRICDILIAALDALGEAHAIGVVHRDLKPENIILKSMRSGSDLVKVVDFGLATIIGGTGTSITRPGIVCGTPDYMSPEQGRGEQVDGRGDIYALGVVLFELLTERLPYVDETPTKVVLRHINDPIPDPREVAPHRAVPESLAAVTNTALAKKVEDRYQEAAAMQEALRKAIADIRTGGKSDKIPCPSCGSSSPAAMSFCGVCGARLTGVFTVPQSQRAPQRSFFPATKDEQAFVGRGRELALVDELRDHAEGAFAWGRVCGESGVGKTRFLAEAAERLSAAGAFVVGGGPHPTGAPVPFGALRGVLAQLLDVEVDDLPRLAADDMVFTEPLTRAGVEELIEPTGLVGLLGVARTAAVAAALVTAVRVARERTGAPRVAIVIDELHSCDGLTMKTVRRLPPALAGESVVLLTADAGKLPLSGDPEPTEILLRGFSPDEAAQFLTGCRDEDGAPSSVAPPPGRRLLLPLYLEQIQALGGTGDDTLPPRLADAVFQRVERLSVKARRILQAAAVLGNRCELEVLREVGNKTDIDGLDALVKRSLVTISGTVVEICHPFVRELIEASTPAEARRDLHRRALVTLTDTGAPLEVRADHAFRTGEPMGALMLLERMGDVALVRGDESVAVLAFRRALELARREMLESGDTVMDAAIMTFSRKLGDAMARSGEVASADGVLREAIDLTGPASTDRAKLLTSLARVANLRDRRRDSMRMLGQALERVGDGVDKRVEVLVQQAMADTRRGDGDGPGAANAYRRAAELERDLEVPADHEARTCLDLGQVLTTMQDYTGALASLKIAERRAKTAGAPALEARVAAAQAKVLELQGEAGAAKRRYAEAAQLAAVAGDADGARMWGLASR